MTDINDATIAFLNQNVPKDGRLNSLDYLYTQLQERQANHQTLITQVSFSSSHYRPIMQKSYNLLPITVAS